MDDGVVLFEQNPEGHDRGAVVQSIHRAKGRLYLGHGRAHRLEISHVHLPAAHVIKACGGFFHALCVEVKQGHSIARCSKTPGGLAPHAAATAGNQNNPL